MKPRQDARWPNAHVQLKKLYDARIPSGMSQEEFGQEYGIGSQSMVWQYLNGHTPLNYDAATKFAEGLRCTIEDISPEMNQAMQRFLPAMGLKKWRRAAALASLSLLMPLISPSPADAAAAHNRSDNASVVYYVNRLRRLCDAVKLFFLMTFKSDFGLA